MHLSLRCLSFVDRKKSCTAKCTNTAASSSAFYVYWKPHSSQLQNRVSEGDDIRRLVKGKQRRQIQVSKYTTFLNYLKKKKPHLTTGHIFKILTTQQPYGKNCKLQSLWKVKLPDFRLFQSNQISFLSNLHEVKGNRNFPSPCRLRWEKIHIRIHKDGKTLRKWEKINLKKERPQNCILIWRIKPQIVLHKLMADDPTSYQTVTVGLTFKVTAEHSTTQVALLIVQSFYDRLYTSELRDGQLTLDCLCNPTHKVK